MTSAEIYRMICDMMLDYLRNHANGKDYMQALHMHVYAACAFYPQDDEWYLAHMGQRPAPIQCTV